MLQIINQLNFKTMKEIIKSIMFAITDESRILKVSTIMEFAGEEYEQKSDFINLAKQTDKQLNNTLKGIAEYYLNEL